MQIYEALKRDHDQLKILLTQLVSIDPQEEEQCAQLVDQIADQFVPHSRAEEIVFYNSLRTVEMADDLALHSFEEHIEAEALLNSLQFIDKSEGEWIATAEKFKQAVEHHIQEEESKVFTVAKQLFTVQEAEMMAVAFERLKPEVRERSFVQSTLDVIANLMPPRLAAPMRTFTYSS